MRARRTAIGIDVGGTTIKGLAVDEEGTILTEVEPVATPRSGARDVVEKASELAEKLRAEIGADAPLGVCVPGIVDETRGIGIYSANLGWHDAPMRQLLEERLEMPVTFGHDVRSGALAESIWGQGISDCLYVAIGTGIASGLIMAGLPAPTAPWAGEIGQIPVIHPDLPGTRVVLESVASAKAIAARGRQAGLIPENAGARLLQEIAEAAPSSPEDQAKTLEARRIYQTSLDLLGHTISVLVHLTGTVNVVIGGGLSKGGEFILAPIREAIARGCSVIPAPPVSAACLGSASQAMGVAAAAFLNAGIDPHQ